MTIALIPGLFLVCPGNQNRYVNSTCTYTLEDFSNLATGTDNCTASSLLSYTQSPALGTVLNSGNQLVTLSVTDAEGLQANCNFNLTVTDTTRPNITYCPPSQNIFANSNCQGIVPDFQDTITFTDNCSASTDVTFTQFPPAANIINTNTDVTLTVTDETGNQNNCIVSIIIQDTTPPVVVCPDNQDRNTFMGCLYQFEDFENQIPFRNDNCSANDLLTYSYTDAQNQPLTPTSMLMAGMHTITLNTTDPSGNSSNCTFIITVIDNEAPNISCPTDSLVDADQNACEYTVPNFTPVRLNDNCIDTTTLSSLLTQSPIGTLPLGMHTVTLTANDEEGNSSNCSFNVSVIDLTPPQISCPDTIKVVAQANCMYSLGNLTNRVTAFDNCNLTLTQSPNSGNFTVGNHDINFRGVDNFNNDSTCVTVLNVFDATPPTLFCPDTIRRFTDQNCGYTLEDITTLTTVNDNCGTVSTTQTPSIGRTYSSVGFNNLIVQATDNSANQAQCILVLELLDNTDPQIINCVNDTVTYVNQSCMATVGDYSGIATINDNCSSENFLNSKTTQTPASGTILALGQYTVTLTTEDESGNSNQCSFNLRAVDTISPVISLCVTDKNISSVNSTCGYTIQDYTTSTELSFSDNCAGSSQITVSQTPIPNSNVSGTQDVVLTTTDPSGNTASCTFKTLVVDNTPPVVICGVDTTVSADPNSPNCQYTVQDLTDHASIFDNCSVNANIKREQRPVAGTLLSTLVNQTIWIYGYDANNNVDSCRFTLQAIDRTPPRINCPSIDSISVDATCNYTVEDYSTKFPVFDNCVSRSSITITQSLSVGTILPHESITPITLTFSDGIQDTSCTYQIAVIDTIAPVFSICPTTPYTIYIDQSCDTIVPDFINLFSISATDNCSIDSLWQNPAAGTNLRAGLFTIEVLAVDSSSNSTTCPVNFQILDTISPTILPINCPNDSTVYTTQFTCDIPFPDFLPQVNGLVTDNCSSPQEIDLLSEQIPSPGALVKADSFNVVITFYDESRNSTSCTFKYNYVDTIAPVIMVCPDTITRFADSNCQYTFTDVDNDVLRQENCTPDALLIRDYLGTITPNTTVNTGYTDIDINYTDEFNNTSTTCSFVLNIKDTIRPSIICPADSSLYLAPSICGFTIRNYLPDVYSSLSDNCTIAPDLFNASQQTPSAGTFVQHQETIRIETTDNSGNSTFCTFTIKLLDSVAPVLICPTDITQNCDSIFNYAPPTFTDCDTSTTLTLTNGLASGAIFPVGKSTVSFSARDSMNNESTCDFTIERWPPVTKAKILDISPVSPVCLEDETINLEASIPIDSTDLNGLWRLRGANFTATDSTIPQLQISTLDTGKIQVEWIIYGKYCDTSTVQQTIEVVRCIKRRVTPPGAFTPNGDGANETWILDNIEDFPNSSITIFNRWGNPVYKSNNYPVHI